MLHSFTLNTNCIVYLHRAWTRTEPEFHFWLLQLVGGWRKTSAKLRLKNCHFNAASSPAGKIKAEMLVTRKHWRETNLQQTEKRLVVWRNVDVPFLFSLFSSQNEISLIQRVCRWIIEESDRRTTHTCLGFSVAAQIKKKTLKRQKFKRGLAKISPMILALRHRAIKPNIGHKLSLLKTNSQKNTELLLNALVWR